MEEVTPMALQYEHWISPEEYLEIDRASLDVKYEYVDGRMYAMTGGTVEHAQIAMNMIRALADHLQGSIVTRDFRLLWIVTLVCSDEDCT